MVWRKLAKSFGISLEVFHLVRLRPLDLLQEGIRRSDKKAIVHEFPKETGAIDGRRGAELADRTRHRWAR